MAVLARIAPVAGAAHASVCWPPSQTVPPLRVGTEFAPSPVPWVTWIIRVRSPSGANHTHWLMPTPAVPQTPPEVATRFPAVLVRSAIADDPDCAPVAGS